ncbi:MAG: Ldh family oxidoreductase, partial [Stappiaceae bacterium]
PAGGYKGVGVALMVELMAAAMTGATLGMDASPFSGTKGGPPKTGQFFLAINPAATSSGLFADRLTSLVEEMHSQPGVRIPGDGRNAAWRKAQKSGVEVNPVTLEKISAWL